MGYQRAKNVAARRFGAAAGRSRGLAGADVEIGRDGHARRKLHQRIAPPVNSMLKGACLPSQLADEEGFGYRDGCIRHLQGAVVMSKFTAEELAQEQKRRKAARDATPDKQQCVNCGRSFSSLTAESSEHGLCDDCLLGDLDE